MEHGLIEYGGCDVFYTVLLLGGRKGWQETMVWNVVVWYCWFVYSGQCGKVGMVNGYMELLVRYSCLVHATTWYGSGGMVDGVEGGEERVAGDPPRPTCPPH